MRLCISNCWKKQLSESAARELVSHFAVCIGGLKKEPKSKFCSKTKCYLLALQTTTVDGQNTKIYSIFSQFHKFIFDLTLNCNNNLSYNCVTDSKEGSEDGDLEHELQDWEKEVINPNNHAELKVPINGVSILFIRFL